MTDDLAASLREICARLEAHGIPFMVVGSLAALVHGRARTTQDFDLVIEASEAPLRAFVRGLPEDRFYASEEAASEALRDGSMFNVIDLQTGWKADLVLRKSRAFSKEEFERRREVEVLGLRLPVATVEDVVVAKLEWSKLGGSSRRQREDVEALLRHAAERLDVDYVERWVRELGLEDEWRALRRHEGH